MLCARPMQATKPYCNHYNHYNHCNLMPRDLPKPKYHNVPVLESTWLRLRDYKVRSQTYDEVLNGLMDSVPLEMLAADVLREHERRLATFRGRDWRKVRDEVRRDRKARGAAGPSRGKRPAPASG